MPTADGHYQVTIEDVHLAHEIALTKGGGRDGIVRLEALLGAIGRPYHGYHETLEEKAAALLHAIASCHGFADANKRTSWLVTMILLEESACRLALKKGENADDVPVDLIEGRLSQDGLVAWFRDRIVPR